MKLLVAQSCLTLYNPVDCSSPGSSVHGILQARILEWVAIAFSIRECIINQLSDTGALQRTSTIQRCTVSTIKQIYILFSLGGCDLHLS